MPAGGRVPHIEFVTRFPATRAIYCHADGTPLRLGQRLRNPDMARTLRRIAENGVDDFYTGAIAREIADDVGRNGGLLSAEDLAAVRPDDAQPLWGSYRGHRVATNNPPGGGIMILRDAEHPRELRPGRDGPQLARVHRHRLRGDEDRHRRQGHASVGDPRFVDVPVGELTSKDYAAKMAERIRRGEKTHVHRLNQGGEEFEGHDAHLRRGRAAATPSR